MAKLNHLNVPEGSTGEHQLQGASNTLNQEIMEPGCSGKTRAAMGPCPLQMNGIMAGCCKLHLVIDHAADLRQEVLADDAVEVPVLGRGLVLDAVGQLDPLLLCVTHQRPSTSFTIYRRESGYSAHSTTMTNGNPNGSSLLSTTIWVPPHAPLNLYKMKLLHKNY